MVSQHPIDITMCNYSFRVTQDDNDSKVAHRMESGDILAVMSISTELRPQAVVAAPSTQDVECDVFKSSAVPWQLLVQRIMWKCVGDSDVQRGEFLLTAEVLVCKLARDQETFEWRGVDGAYRF